MMTKIGKSHQDKVDQELPGPGLEKERDRRKAIYFNGAQVSFERPKYSKIR